MNLTRLREDKRMLERQTILVTGATGSIGRSVGLGLAKRGARVVLIGRRPGKLATEVEGIRAALDRAGVDSDEADVTKLVVDFSAMNSVRDAAQDALDRFPVINGLVLSVAVFAQGGPNILPGNHELMFATNVMGPFLLTELLLPRLEASDGMVVHVVAPFHEPMDWEDVESIRHHRTTRAFNRTKTCNRAMAGELARRYTGRICSVAYDPAFVIDKSDPDLKKRWPKGIVGFFWRILAFLFAKPPSIAGEPLAELLLSDGHRSEINGAMFKLDRIVEKPDEAMNDLELGRRLWDDLAVRTGLVTA
jgi:NAD(P)-dependent dehydrogenase (short-subunit alcohol dehydrogenase family)